MSTMAPRLSPSQMPSPEDYAALLRSMENGSANDNDSWTWWNTVSWISYCGSIPFRIIRQALSMTYSWEMTRSNAPSLKDRVTLESIDIESEGMRFTLLDEAPESAPSTGSWGGIAGTLISAPITTLRDWMFGRLPDWHERQHGLGLGAICEAVRAKIEPGSFIDPSRLSHFQNATRMAADRLLSPLYKSHWDKHESFIFHLRQACLLSAEEEPGKISEEASLLKAMIYGRFLHNHIHSFCTELLRLFRDHTLTSVAQQYGLTVTKESQKKLPLIQRLWLFFLIVKHADAELKGSPLQRIYDSFCGEFNYYFDPHKWGNIPHRLYTLVYQQPEGSEKRIPNIRMGTPTQQVDSSVPNAASTSVIPEFRQFLEFCRQEGKLHVYFNFQRLWATAVHGDESQRCNAIMQLEEEFPEAFAFISLSKDSAFYHQKDGFENSIPTDLFASLYIERLLEAQSGNFYLSPSLRTPEMKNWLLKVLVNSGKRLLGQKAVYDASERRKVAEEFHQHLARRMVEFQSAIANPAALFILPSEDEVHALASHATHSDLEWAAHCSQKVLAYAPDLQQWASEMLLTELQSASDAEESPYEHRKIALKSLLKAASERLREEGASKGCIVLSAFDPAIAEDSGLFEDKCRSRLFIQTFLHQCFEAKKSGFHFPKRLRTPKFRADVKRIMDEVWEDVFCQSTHLSVGEKKDFIEIVYVRLMRHIIEVLEPDSYNASCKDCIDRGAGANSLFFWFQRYLEGLDDSKEAQDDLIVMTLAPALLVRQRHIYHHRLARMTDAMKRLQGSGVRERILARLAHSKIRGIEIQRQKGQGLRSKCTEANSFVEYRKAISADATFDRSKRWSKLVQEILADEQMQEKTHMLRGADGEPQKLIPGQFARDVPRQLITINGQSFNDVPGIEGKIQAAYAALCTAAGHNEMKIDTLARVGTQSIVNALFERLNSRFTNTNIHIQLRQASEDLPQPSIVNYVVSESQAQLHAQTLYKIDCVDPESADAAKIAGRAFIPIYLRGELSIDLDRPTHTSYRYSLVSDEQLKELKKAGLVAGASDDLEEDWVMTKSEDKAL